MPGGIESASIPDVRPVRRGQRRAQEQVGICVRIVSLDEKCIRLE